MGDILVIECSDCNMRVNVGWKGEDYPNAFKGKSVYDSDIVGHEGHDTLCYSPSMAWENIGECVDFDDFFNQ